MKHLENISSPPETQHSQEIFCQSHDAIKRNQANLYHRKSMRPKMEKI